MSSSGSSMTVATRRLGRTFGPGWTLSATPPAPRLKSPPTCWTYGCSDSCARRPWITNILSSPRIERPRRRVPSAARASPTRTAACDAESAASRPASKTLGPVRIPVETVRPKLTHRSRISGREPQRNMTLSEAAAPPGRGKDVLVEFPQDELIAKWEEFFEEMGYLSKIIAIADRFPEERSLLVAFDELNRFDTDMAIYLLRHPLNVLLAGEEAIRRLAPPGDEGAQIDGGPTAGHGRPVPMPPMRDDHQGTPGRADLPRAARVLRRARRMQALRERDEVQAPHGDLALRRHAEARNPRGARRLARRRGAPTAHALPRGRPDGTHHARRTGRHERRPAKRPEGPTQREVHAVRHLHGRQLGRKGTGRVRGDRGHGGGRPAHPRDGYESGHLPDDHRVHRPLHVRDARGEGSARPAALQRGPEGDARWAAHPRGHPCAHGRRSRYRQERAALVHEPPLASRDLCNRQVFDGRRTYR